MKKVMLLFSTRPEADYDLSIMKDKLDITTNILNRIKAVLEEVPLDVLDFHNFMSRSFLILTDSGGI